MQERQEPRCLLSENQALDGAMAGARERSEPVITLWCVTLDLLLLLSEPQFPQLCNGRRLPRDIRGQRPARAGERTENRREAKTETQGEGDCDTFFILVNCFLSAAFRAPRKGRRTSLQALPLSVLVFWESLGSLHLCTLVLLS